MATSARNLRKRSAPESDLPAAKRRQTSAPGPCDLADAIDKGTYKWAYPLSEMLTEVQVPDDFCLEWDGRPLKQEYRPIVTDRPTFVTKDGRYRCSLCAGDVTIDSEYNPDLHRLRTCVGRWVDLCRTCRTVCGICPGFKGGSFGPHLTWARPEGPGLLPGICGDCWEEQLQAAESDDEDIDE
jgi:hypothetical protein